MMAKDKMYIGKMIVIELAAFAVLILAGIGLCIWFSDAAKPAVRTLRDTVAWTEQFAAFFYSGCIFSLIYSVAATFMAGKLSMNKRINWCINTVVITLVAIAMSVLFLILTPSKNAACWITAAVAILLQGPIIFIPASCFQPGHWAEYCPFAR